MNKTIIITLLMFGLLSCSGDEGEYRDGEIVGFIFDQEPNDKDVPFTPSHSEIEEAEAELLKYLTEHTKAHDPIIVSSVDEKEPLETKLKYYYRRYFGRINIEGEKVIKTEFVFVRCRKGDQWKEPDFIDSVLDGCWFDVKYNIDRKNIYGL